MRQKINLKEAYDFFKLNPKKKTLLVMGGSQGARGVNRAIAATLPQLDELGVQILHITGPAEYQTVRDEYAKHKQLNAQVLAFCHRMELAYTVADLAIARSGASSMTELAYFGLPSILVPYPHAADDHQTKNAEIFAKTGAALLITEDNLSPQVLASEVIKILDHKLPHHKKMKVAATKMAVRNSAEVIAAIIESLATEKAKA
jgi:UDP-N-acetylglucosamine--N-acetylmuramyl-(pentapeptide) pyrophosphoryl-undecaprenol N-acetylglucosamine transferase